MQALLVPGEQQVQVRTKMEDDGCGRRVGIKLEVYLREEVLGAAEDVKYSPEGGSWHFIKNALTGYGGIAHLSRTSRGRSRV